MINFSLELHELDEAITPYGTIETSTPSESVITVDDFTDGVHFRTAPESNSLVLDLEDRALTLLLDESGSMTWNDVNNDRYTYASRLLTKLRDTYPGNIVANIIGFGGVPVVSKLLVKQSAGDFLLEDQGQDINALLQDVFEDSVYDFAGIRVVRRTDRYPTHPADGIIVNEGIFDAVKDEDLTEGQRYYYGVWTFNKDLNFSEGKFITGIPQDRILPRGVNFASATPRILPGVLRDEYTQIIYNFVEGSGYTVFDSSGRGHHAVLGSQTIPENFWIGDGASSSQNNGEPKKNIGARFDGSFDILEVDAGDEIGYNNTVSTPAGLTVNFWIYRYASSTNSWIIGTGLSEPSSTVGWGMYVTPEGFLYWGMNDLSYFSVVGLGETIPLETWTMITLVIHETGASVSFNAVAIEPFSIFFPSNSLNLNGMEKLYIGALPTDSSFSWNGGDFFGVLANISIHSTDRSSDYINALYETELAIFDQPLQQSSEDPADNTQREVLLSWTIEDDYDFQNGEVRIVRKYREVPSHENDGDILLSQTAESGQFFYLDTYNFINNADYYYRIFTFNSMGNPCDRNEAKVLPVRIPKTPSGTADSAPSPVTNVSVINGSRKVMLQWTNPVDPEWMGTRIFFGPEKYPTISLSAQGELVVTDGFEIFDTQEIDKQSFVHRKIGIDDNGAEIPLENGKFHFYTLLTYNNLGQFSDAKFITGIPQASLSVTFPPTEVKDVHITIVNPETLSVQWISPIAKADNLNLFFGESALIFVNIRDIFGGDLDDLVNISLQVCTTITNRELLAKETALGILGVNDALDGPCGSANSQFLINGGCSHGSKFDEDCNNEQEKAETVLNFSKVESGLIKGTLSHISDPNILSRRSRYEMSVRAQYRIVDPETDKLLFEMNTSSVNVSFQHPLDIAILNRDNRKILPLCGNSGKTRGTTICFANCGSDDNLSGSTCSPEEVNGTHINATNPYIARIELQYRGEALPDGTPVSVSLFKRSTENPLSIKSDRVSIREGIYNTISIQETLVDERGNEIDGTINKSYIDVAIPAPSLPEKVDLYVSVNYLGFIVDAIHEVEFIGSLFVSVNTSTPIVNGIDTAEQFASVWTIDPDDPTNITKKVPVPDGTLVKWELVKLRHGKDRPFFSTETLNEFVSGVYSTTNHGVARNVFFGPISNVDNHTVNVCGESCCLGEEYAIKASVVLGDETAVDSVYMAFPCIEDNPISLSSRLFINAASGQQGQAPNYISWADGESLLKFGIAKNPAIVTDQELPGADCFRACSENILGGQFFTLPEGHIVQITAPGEILWNVVFGSDVDTGNIQTFTSDINDTLNNALYRTNVTPDETTVWSNPTDVWPIGYVNIAGVEYSADGYLRFEINIPKNNIVQSCVIQFTPDELQAGVRAQLGISVLDPSGIQSLDLSEENSNTILSQGIIGGLAEEIWEPDGTILGGEWTENVPSEASTTVDLSDFIQEFINRSSYEPGQFITIRIRNLKPNGSEMSVIQPHSADSSYPPQLIIEYAPPVVSGNNLISYDSATIADTKSTATAGIPVKGDVTDFYVRINKFIGDDNNPQPEDCGSNQSRGIGGGGTALLQCEWENDCKLTSECSPVKGVKWKKVSPISAQTTFISNNVSVTLIGGGGYETGIPPILVGFKEPLNINIIEARINGQRLSSHELVVDGFSQHTIVVEAEFSDSPVPDGTPLELLVEGDTDIVKLSNCLSSSTRPGCSPSSSGIIYTSLVNDPFINPTGDKRSLAYFTIDPLPNIAFNAKINITCRYDKLNSASRSITRCVEVNNTVNVDVIDPELPVVESIPSPIVSVVSNESIVYDTVTDQYGLVTGSSINRIGHFAAHNESSTDTGTNSYLYVFGGYTDRDIDGSIRITPTTERYDIENDEWSFITDMPTPRSNGMTAVSNDIIYCIGGLELNPITNQYVVSRKIESYDTVNNVWNSTLTPMPVSYGVAFGHATHDGGDNIYVLCGLNTVINNNQPGILNDRILRYTISSDTWVTIHPSDEEYYKRISPFGFFRSSPYDGNLGNALGYIYSGSVHKTLAEVNAEYNSALNQRLNNFRSFILTSSYYLSLTDSEQVSFIKNEEQSIKDSIEIPPFIYLSTGFKYEMGSEYYDSADRLILDISDHIDNEWNVLPKPRDRGQAVYISSQDTVYFIGGSNQNNSTTLNRVESIDFSNSNLYVQLTSLSRGRSLFTATAIQNEIYFSGGLTSGHRDGYVQIEVLQSPTLVEANGTQSSGLVVLLKDDAGELINQNIRCMVRGRIRIPDIDDVLTTFLAERAADRALGGDGSGNAPTPEPGEPIDYDALIKAQNSVLDPNSDQFQFNASKTLGEQVLLFPVLYSKQEFTISGGIGGVTLLPRSEDPLADFYRLSQFIKESLAETPENPDERFQGDLTREELASLGDVLQTVSLPPTILNSNTIRNLYQIETVITIIDDFYFGQNVSDFDRNVQDSIKRKIETILTPPTPPPTTPPPEDSGGSGGSDTIPFAGVPVSDSKCFLLQHIAAQEIQSAQQPPPENNRPNSGVVGTGGFNQSGQCLFCQNLLPLTPAIKPQAETSVISFYGSHDWVPQIKRRLSGGTVNEALEEIDTIDHEIPFGSSQLYSSMKEAAILTSGETFESLKKVFYVLSDNSENYSLITRDQAIDEINAVDGPGKSPVIYTIFSTSFPVSLSAQLEKTEVGDVEKIVKETGGQSSILNSSGFINQVLNRSIGGTTGGIGWGKYVGILDLEELSAITNVTTSFYLPSNTSGRLRFRHTQDGFNFNDWSEYYIGNQNIDFIDFFARLIEFEVTLTTGFSADITPEYDSIPTGIPKLFSITFGTSQEKEDFIFLNPDTVLTNAQQVAVAFEGDVPSASIVEIGVASSNSHDWRDFQSTARPALREFGKTFLINRTPDSFNLVDLETLKTRDGLLYEAPYGAWDSTSTVSLFKVNSAGLNIPVTSGFRVFPREGQIYFDNRQSLSTVYKVSIVNSDQSRVGIRLLNRLHTDSISIKGVGYIYSTNDIKPVELSQVAPRATNVTISPVVPNSSDTFFVLYDYIDLNGDPESGTVIKWFKNNSQLFELNNKTSWNNSILQNNHKLEPGDRIIVTVTPSDSKNFGTTVYSSPVTIAPSQPSARNLTVVPIRNDTANNRYDTASTFRVQYVFHTDDTGNNAKEFGTVIRWFVNGFLFKEGTFSKDAELPTFDPRELSPNEVGTAVGPNQGISAHVIGKEILVEVTPKTLVTQGSTTISQPFIVTNSVPIVSNVKITPASPKRGETLVLTFDTDDPDINDSVETQTNQSIIEWFVSVNGTVFTKDENAPTSDGLQVPPVFTELGQKWKVKVTPFDGLDLGSPVESNVVTIL